MRALNYTGEHDTRRQALNVFRMEILGAKVIAVNHGEGSMKEAIDEALGDLAQNYKKTLFIFWDPQ